MLKKEITYIDLNGNERTEEYYFNMTRAEMLEYDVAFSAFGGVIPYLTMLVKTQDNKKLFDAFKDLILRSYGEKTDSGRFIKSQELRDSFMASEAYSELFMEIIESETSAAAFINGVMPNVPAKKEPEIVPVG